jgi:clan AA aspartic protease (TIGR02281 family)
MIQFRIAKNMLELALAMASLIAVARGDQLEPEDVLKSHGLSVKRGGSTYVLAAEAEIQLKLSDAQRVFKQLNIALRRRYDFEQVVEQRRRLVPGLLEERIFLNQQLRALDRQDVVTHNQIVSRLNEISDQLNLLQVTTADPKQKQDVDNEVAENRGRYIQEILDIRALVDSTLRQYAELAQDDTIKTAIEALNSKTKSPLKLGPSRGFDENVKQLVIREKSVLSKAVEMRQRGGVFEVDVTLNGRETIPMIFDTGAAFLTLSSDFAAKIGLTPEASDQTVQLHDASGGITQAKMMTIPTVRVGPFTVNNVDCAVLPPNKRDVPLLLGQSFINQFTHKVDNGRLVLSKVETPETPRNTATTPKKTTKAKRSSKYAAGAKAPTSDGSF